MNGMMAKVSFFMFSSSLVVTELFRLGRADHSFKGGFRRAVAVEEKWVICSPSNRPIIAPRIRVGYAPKGYALNAFLMLQEYRKQVSVPLGQLPFALPFGFAFERVIVVVELGYGIGIVCKLKCPFDVVGADDFHPRRLAHCPVFIKRFVHHVPAVNPPFISAHHGMDMVAHPLQ